MAMIEVDGLIELGLDFEQLAEMPDTVLEDMLNSAADVVAKAQKDKGLAMNVRDTGDMLDSIRKGRVKRTEDGAVVYIAPRGSRAGRERNNQVIAFMNEYGTASQPPRPFIRDANEEAADEAVEAAEKVFDTWLQSKDL